MLPALQVVGPDHRSFLHRLVHAAAEALHLRYAGIVEEKLPFPQRHLEHSNLLGGGGRGQTHKKTARPAGARLDFGLMEWNPPWVD